MATLIAAMSACSSEGSDQNSESAATATEMSSTDASPAEGSTTGGVSEGRSASSAEFARTAALASLADSGSADAIVVGQDWDDDGGWSVTAVSGTQAYTVDIRDGEVKDTETQSADDSEREAAGAKVGISDAIAAALDSVPGELDEAEFADGVWVMSIDTETEDDVEVQIDAQTGGVLS